MTSELRKAILPLLLASALGLSPSASTTLAQQPQGRDAPAYDFNAMWSRGKAEGDRPVTFTHSPMRLEDIAHITPLGLMVGGHVTPIDHQYYYPKPLKAGQDHFDVLAPADGFVVMVGHRVKLEGTTEKQRGYDDYALTIEHSRTIYSHYDLLTRLDGAILDRLDRAVRERFERKTGGPPTHVRIPVKAGQVLGKVGGRSLDFGVVNAAAPLKGFLTPSLYGHYAWRACTVDPFNFFEEPLKGRLLQLNPRKAEPRGGKIAYDLDGRLVGNWFKEGTGGYAGNRDKRGYWMGHLALVYHHVDPSVVIVSIGDFDGRPRQFAVVGNGPDPAQVSAKDGPVKYELVYAPLGGSGQRLELPDKGTQGVLLVQLLEGRKLKVEAFPGKAARDVNAFTTAAATYER